MKSEALRVARADGERTRTLLRELGALRLDLRIEEEGGWIFLPLQPGRDVNPVLGTVVEREFKSAESRGPQDYRELLPPWPSYERDALPRSFDVIGDIVLVRVPPSLSHRGPEIGAALLRFVPGARIVGSDHGVRGPERRRTVERLAGSGGWSTRHKENGLEFDVDVERAYFSPRLAREHARVAAEIRTGDRVYDLCCGVGPFAVTIARAGRASHVTAIDVNLVAIELLCSTLHRYPFASRVEARVTSVEQFLERAGPVESVVLNLPHEGIKYLPSVAKIVSPLGQIFFYEVVDREGAGIHEGELIARLGGPSEWRVRDRHVTHPYSPTADLVAFTFEHAPP